MKKTTPWTEIFAYFSRVFLLAIFCSLGFGAISACGKRMNTSYNDPAPTNGTIITQGNFGGGGSVSGDVVIYNMGSGTYIIRLVSLNAPDESGLQMIPVVDGVRATSYSLKGSSGNQNYTFTYNGSGSPVWNQIVIRSVQQNADLGVAGLQSPLGQ